VSVLAIAYHNLGVEQEHLKMYLESLESYRQAKEFATQYLGEEDPIAVKLLGTYKRAAGEIQGMLKRSQSKKKQQEVKP